MDGAKILQFKQRVKKSRLEQTFKPKPSDEELSERIERIRTSITRINQLITELRNPNNSASK